MKGIQYNTVKAQQQKNCVERWEVNAASKKMNKLVNSFFFSGMWDNVIDIKHRAIVTHKRFQILPAVRVYLFFVCFLPYMPL